MALGTITVNKVVRMGDSSFMIADVSIVGDDAYPTGGTLLFESTLRDAIEAGDGLSGSLSNLDLLGVEKIDGLVDSDAHYVAATDALMVRDGDGTQKTGATDQSGDTYRLLTFWR